jgi:argininosuccinate lyase
VNQRDKEYGYTALQGARFQGQTELVCELMKFEEVVGKNVEWASSERPFVLTNDELGARRYGVWGVWPIDERK